MRRYPGYPPQVEDHEELDRWAAAYCRAAKAKGCSVDFTDESGESLVANTVRLVCELYSFNGWQDWLGWQQWGRPKGRGPWYIMDSFEEPWPWYAATIFIKNPWDFAFSHFFMASKMRDVEFAIRKPQNRRFKPGEHLELGRAIYDGMFYDFDPADGEFRVVLTRHPAALHVWLWNPLMTDMDDFKLKPDKHGLFWLKS